jgi:PhzF family phenazine biosynthesis protein
MRRRFTQVDVFSAEPFRGNPVAVVDAAQGLSTEQMQQLAHWTNLSETTFLLPPSNPRADYRVRIFTPSSELPFAGHPTLGTCHAWLAGGGKPRSPNAIVQECAAGLVPLRRIDGRLAFAAPPQTRTGPINDALLAHVVAMLGIERRDVVDAQWADNGPNWVAVLLESAEAVLALEPAARNSGHGDIGVIGLYPPGAECAYEVRAFYKADARGTVREDPVTGSFNASAAQWLLASGRVKAPYVASQGARVGCRGRVRIHEDTDRSVWVGGDTAAHVNGEIEI